MKIAAVGLFVAMVFCSSCANKEIVVGEKVIKGVVLEKLGYDTLLVKFEKPLDPRIFGDEKIATCAVDKEIYEQAKAGSRYDFVETKYKSGKVSYGFRFSP